MKLLPLTRVFSAAPHSGRRVNLSSRKKKKFEENIEMFGGDFAVRWGSNIDRELQRIWKPKAPVAITAHIV